MNQETKVLIGIVVVTVGILVGGAWLSSRGSNAPATASRPDLLVKSDSYHTGKSDVKVTVVEFGDYQCPACGAAYPVLRQMLADYGDKVNFVFRNFPLPQHQNALIGAEAAEAAGAQGKYWEMHDVLYDKQAEWGESTTPLDFLVKYADGLHLNMDQFKSDVQANKYADRITADQNDGLANGINATPTIFVNGQIISGVPTYADLKSMIDAAQLK